MITKKSFGTHNGTFHADEVTACALLLQHDLIERDKIHRTRDPEILDQCEFVCDVGGIYNSSRKRFDHHQIDYKGPLSSAGMILKYLKEEKILTEDLYEYLNRSLVMGVDAHDNGVAHLEYGFCSFSQVISNFLPVRYNVTHVDRDEAFMNALDFAVNHLQRLVERYHYACSCKSKVRDSMARDKYCLRFDESLPWLENFFELGGELHPAIFVIMPSDDHWKLRAIPPSLNQRMKVRLGMPKEWAGLQDEELQKISKIPGAIFCHKGLFISIWKSQNDAEKALHYILEKNEIE